jgi:hypothetical protein
MQGPQQAGVAAKGRLLLIIATKLLMQSIPHLGVGSDDLKAALQALNGLKSITGPVDEGLRESEIGALKQTSQNAPVPGGPPGAAAGAAGMPGMAPQGPAPMRMGGGY